MTGSHSIRNEGQSTNLANQHPERAKAMRTLLDQYTSGERCAPLR